MTRRRSNKYYLSVNFVCCFRFVCWRLEDGFPLVNGHYWLMVSVRPVSIIPIQYAFLHSLSGLGRWIMNIFVYVSNNFPELMTFFTRLKSMTGADVFISIQLKLMHSCWWNFCVAHDRVTFWVHQIINSMELIRYRTFLLTSIFNVPSAVNEAIRCEELKTPGNQNLLPGITINWSFRPL